MKVDFEDSLKRLKLVKGVDGVQELMPWLHLSKVFTDAPADEHLHIVVERPTSASKFEHLIGPYKSDESIPHSSSLTRNSTTSSHSVTLFPPPQFVRRVQALPRVLASRRSF